MTITSGQVELTEHVLIRPLAGNIGAEIEGIDLSEPLSDDAYAQIRGAFNTYGVVFFRNQHLTAR
jgi:taurine dioxygenase